MGFLQTLFGKGGRQPPVALTGADREEGAIAAQGRPPRLYDVPRESKWQTARRRRRCLQMFEGYNPRTVQKADSTVQSLQHQESNTSSVTAVRPQRRHLGKRWNALKVNSRTACVWFSTPRSLDPTLENASPCFAPSSRVRNRL